MKHIVISVNLDVTSESQLRAIEHLAIKHNAHLELVPFMLEGRFFNLSFLCNNNSPMGYANEEQDAITNEIEMAIAQFN